MYGYRVLRNTEQAYELDKENGNTKWSDSITVEMNNVLSFGSFADHGKGGRAPRDSKQINVHLVFTVKHDG
jgi:hypothetical protein